MKRSDFRKVLEEKFKLQPGLSLNPDYRFSVKEVRFLKFPTEEKPLTRSIIAELQSRQITWKCSEANENSQQICQHQDDQVDGEGEILSKSVWKRSPKKSSKMKLNMRQKCSKKTQKDNGNERKLVEKKQVSVQESNSKKHHKKFVDIFKSMKVKVSRFYDEQPTLPNTSEKKEMERKNQEQKSDEKEQEHVGKEIMKWDTFNLGIPNKKSPTGSPNKERVERKMSLQESAKKSDNSSAVEKKSLVKEPEVVLIPEAEEESVFDYSDDDWSSTDFSDNADWEDDRYEDKLKVDQKNLKKTSDSVKATNVIRRVNGRQSKQMQVTFKVPRISDKY